MNSRCTSKFVSILTLKLGGCPNFIWNILKGVSQNKYHFFSLYFILVDNYLIFCDEFSSFIPASSVQCRVSNWCVGR